MATVVLLGILSSMTNASTPSYSAQDYFVSANPVGANFRIKNSTSGARLQLYDRVNDKWYTLDMHEGAIQISEDSEGL